ncbi:MAG TPA: glycosyltransferase family 2 protein [Flavobacteriia bacterium]|nr:glycosyltransferase family 2 protein [Flavobacteriia bacterium]
MKGNKKVSILIPLYNSEEYIEETIKSCLNQTYSNIEIIIIDDGSTDIGLKIARDYENKYQNIIVETQKNSGAPAARNRAFSISTGDYIQYLDADDLLHPDKIYLQVELLQRYDSRAVAFGKYGYFQETINNIQWKELYVNKNYDCGKQFLIELWTSGKAVIPHSWLLPRILVEESRGWDETLIKNQDGEFFARIVFAASRIYFVKNSLSYYRTDNANSISKQVSKKALQSTLKSFDTYEKLMKDNLANPEVRNALVSIYSQFIYRIYPLHLDLINELKLKIRSLGFKEPLMDMKYYEYFLSKLIGIYNVLKLKKFVQKLIKYNT